MATPTRPDVKAVLDYLLAREINLDQAREQLEALGLQLKGELEKFVAGFMSCADVFTAWGV